MGRSKKGAGGAAVKLFCYWCDKEFTEESQLINHQVAKHFRCPECKPSSGALGKCSTLEMLMYHYRKVHLTELPAVPHALEGREAPKDSWAVYGMDNVPEEMIQGWGLKWSSVSHMMAKTQVEEKAPATAQRQLEVLANALSISTKGGTVEDMPGIPSNGPPAASSAESGTGCGPDSQDWSQMVKQWMVNNKPVEQPPPLPQVDTVRPPSSAHDYPPVQASNVPPSPLDFGRPDAGVQGTGLQGTGIQSGPANAMAASAIIAQANAMAEAARSAKLAAESVVSHAAVNIRSAQPGSSREPTESQPPLAVSTPRVPRSRSPRSRSRSRQRRWESTGGRRGRSSSRRRYADRDVDGRYDRRDYDRRRSRSRDAFPPHDGSRRNDRRDQDRRRSRSRNGNSAQSQPNALRDHELNPAEGRTVQVIGGTIRSRLIFKREMEKFGQVEVVYWFNRHDPSKADSESPSVKFATDTAAQAAIAAINAGQVSSFCEGVPVKAVYKRSGARQPERRPNEASHGGQRGLDITSRDIARDFASRRY